MRRGVLTKFQAAIIVTIIVCAAVIGVFTWWVTRRKPIPSPLPGPAAEIGLGNLTRTETVIKVEAEGIVLHYQNESFWEEDQFSTILDHKAEFTSNLINQFNASLSIYGERDEYAVDVNVEFDEARKATIFTCDILGAISKSGNSYHSTFKWLLRSLGLDFINSYFTESEKELYWEGPISGIPTTITLSFPAPIAHCHAHVWWEI